MSSSSGSPARPGSSSDEAALRDEISKLKSDLAQLRDDLRNDLRSIGSDVSAAAGAGVSAAKGRVHRAVDSAVEEGKEDIALFEQRIKDHPLASVAIALGAGLLIGAVISKS